MLRGIYLGTTNGSYISSDVALYYLTLGEEYFKENGNVGEYSAYNIMNLIENNQQMTPLEKQEVWEVIIYLKMTSWTIEVFTSGKQFPADFIGKYSLSREWDTSLQRYNMYLLNNKWGKVHNYGDVPKWKEFQDFYTAYKQFLKRKQLIIMDEDDYGGMLTPTQDDLYKVRREKYVGKGMLEKLEEKELVERIENVHQYKNKAIYELDDYLTIFEEGYPSIKTNNNGERVTDIGVRKEFLDLVNKITKGISLYDDWFYETEVLI